ncbi:MAG: hypothetical protein HY717_14490 [Planctomycetes bacterium]|nr:hypothetical protein [Planctomycetota bacterium]
MNESSQGRWRITTWHDPGGLRVEWKILAYRDYPAAEMRLAFEYRGEQKSDLLCEVRPLRQRTSLPAEMIYATGGLGGWWLEPVTGPIPANFQPAVRRLEDRSGAVRLEARDGWSSNHHLPFWLVMAPDGQGLYYGLGWTGQWAATFTPGPDRTLTVQVGMEHLNLRLLPGERISQPSVLVGYFAGGRWADRPGDAPPQPYSVEERHHRGWRRHPYASDGGQSFPAG